MRVGSSRDNYDEHTHTERGGVSQVVRNIFGGGARDLIVSIIAASAVMTSLWLWSKLHDADKDIQTQIWLRDDALTKFEQGPYADLKAHVLALEITCKNRS